MNRWLTQIGSEKRKKEKIKKNTPFATIFSLSILQSRPSHQHQQLHLSVCSNFQLHDSCYIRLQGKNRMSEDETFVVFHFDGEFDWNTTNPVYKGEVYVKDIQG
ncbi:hypothetical protein AAC387_Pa08g1336 [Persea americana]